jgi:hypothetical protein
MAGGWGVLSIAMYISTKQMDLLMSFLQSASILEMKKLLRVVLDG